MVGLALKGINVLRTHVHTDGYATNTHSRLDYLLASVLHDEQSGRATVFVLNCSTDDEMGLDVKPRQHRDCSFTGSRLPAKLRPLSWNVFVSDPA